MNGGLSTVLWILLGMGAVVILLGSMGFVKKQFAEFTGTQPAQAATTTGKQQTFGVILTASKHITPTTTPTQK